MEFLHGYFSHCLSYNQVSFRSYYVSPTYLLRKPEQSSDVLFADFSRNDAHFKGLDPSWFETSCLTWNEVAYRIFCCRLSISFKKYEDSFSLLYSHSSSLSKLYTLLPSHWFSRFSVSFLTSFANLLKEVLLEYPTIGLFLTLPSCNAFVFLPCLDTPNIISEYL